MQCLRCPEEEEVGPWGSPEDQQYGALPREWSHGGPRAGGIAELQESSRCPWSEGPP